LVAPNWAAVEAVDVLAHDDHALVIVELASDDPRFASIKCHRHELASEVAAIRQRSVRELGQVTPHAVVDERVRPLGRDDATLVGWPPAIGLEQDGTGLGHQILSCPVADSIADSVRMPRLTKWRRVRDRITGAQDASFIARV